MSSSTERNVSSKQATPTSSKQLSQEELAVGVPIPLKLPPGVGDLLAGVAYLHINGNKSWSILHQEADGTAFVTSDQAGKLLIPADRLELKVHWITPIHTEGGSSKVVVNAPRVDASGNYGGPSGNFTAEFYATATDKRYGTWTNSLKI